MCSLAHLGQTRRHLFGVAAVVAEQPAVALVIGQGERAVDALNALAAGAAGHEARKAAAVQQDDGLLAVLEALAERFQEFAGEGGLLAGLEELLPHVDQLHRGQGPGLDAAGQFQQGVLAALGVVAALEAGGGGAQHDAGAGGLRAHDGHVAAVVARGLLLLVAAVVLLIDHDQPQIAYRREHARPGSDHHGGGAASGCGATARSARHR